MNESPPRPVTPESLIAFFREKEINAACRRCPKVGWHVVDGDNARGVAPKMLGNDGAPSPTALFSMIPLVCKNCGNVWFISRITYENWLKERSGAGPE